MKWLKGNTIPGILCIAMGTIFLVPALSMGFFTKLEHQPGSGFFPTLISICLILMGVFMLVSGILSDGKIQYFQITNEIKENLKIFFALLAALVMLATIWRLFQFEAAAFLFCIVINLYLKRGWKFSVCFSVCFIFLIHVIFVTGLRIQF